MTKEVAAEMTLRARLAASDELAKEMTLLRRTILSSEHRGDWLIAEAARKELKRLHDLSARRDYSASH